MNAKRMWVLALVMGSTTPVLAEQARPTPVSVGAGKDRLLPTTGAVRRLAVANPAVATVQVDHAGQVRVHGLQPGETEVNIWSAPDDHHTAYAVHVER